MKSVLTHRFAVAVLAALAAGLCGIDAQAQPTPRKGGTAIIALIQEPGGMNRFVTNQSGAFLGKMVVEGLFEPDAGGIYHPVLAAELPTVANGGLSADGLTVRVKLRPNVKWSDGAPLTADDFVFTYQAYTDPASTPAGSAITPAWRLIDSVRALDPLTLEVKMKKPNPAYPDLFNVVLPRHKFDGKTTMTNQHPQSRMPLGTGPFVVREWRTGDTIVFARNLNYRTPDRPYLDQVVVKVIPNREVAMQSLIRGEVDTMYFPVTGDLPALQRAQKEGKGVQVGLQGAKSWVEWLWINMSDNGDPKKPHPVLGDPAVREAIDLAINRRQIIDQVFSGLGQLNGSLIYAGWAAVDIPAAPYDPARAGARLDAAGWRKDADGVRSKGGVRASLRFQTISGDRTRELYQQMIQQNLKEVGIEVKIQNVPSNVIFGGYKEGGLIKRGNYDLMMSRAGYTIDPVTWVNNFISSEVPSAENVEGANTMFFANAKYDKLVTEAGSIVDRNERARLYKEAAQLFAVERPALSLYSSAWGWAWNTRLKGVSIDHWQGMWPLSADWHVTP